MTGAGHLNRRLTLEAPTETDDEVRERALLRCANHGQPKLDLLAVAFDHEIVGIADRESASLRSQSAARDAGDVVETHDPVPHAQLRAGGAVGIDRGDV